MTGGTPAGAGGVALGPTAVFAGSALVIGAIAGGLFALGNDGPAPVGSTLVASVPVYACPGEGHVGDLRQGDRPYIVGQSDGYYAVRNIRGDGEVVYIDAQFVTPDADPTGLPTMTCDTDATLTVALPSPSATPAPVPEPAPVEDTPGPAAPQPAPAPPQPPPPPPDQQAPVISNASVSPGTFQESPAGAHCAYPTVGTITANVTDNVGVASVVATWTVGSSSFSTPLTGGTTRTGSFGPFPHGTATNAAPWYSTTTVTVTAYDAAGNSSSTQLGSVSVWDYDYCDFG